MVLETISGQGRRPLFRAPPPFEPASLPYLLLNRPVHFILHTFFNLITYFRTHPSPGSPPIRIVCISDTHEMTCEVPDGDILIHAGDLTNSGSVAEIQKQVDWLAGLPHRHVVVIAGNHDSYLDPRSRGSLTEDQRAGTINWKRVHYLQHCTVTLTVDVHQNSGSEDQGEREGLLSSSSAPATRKLRLYGAPQIPACGPMNKFAFQYPRGADAWSETVPEDIDILITHTPPKHHLDIPLPDGLGCEHLLAEVKRIKPRLHVFGHVHWGAGKQVYWWSQCQEAYESGMNVKTGFFRGLLSPRLWWSVAGVVIYGFKELLWDKVWGGERRSTLMVNAAQMKGNTGKLGNPVQVVEI